jgi:hypothetical protein
MPGLQQCEPGCAAQRADRGATGCLEVAQRQTREAIMSAAAPKCHRVSLAHYLQKYGVPGQVWILVAAGSLYLAAAEMGAPIRWTEEFPYLQHVPSPAVGSTNWAWVILFVTLTIVCPLAYVPILREEAEVSSCPEEARTELPQLSRLSLAMLSLVSVDEQSVRRALARFGRECRQSRSTGQHPRTNSFGRSGTR